MEWKDVLKQVAIRLRMDQCVIQQMWCAIAYSFLEPRSASADRGNFGAQPSQDFGGGFGGGYGGTPSFQQQAPASNGFGGNPFGGAPSMDQGFGNPSQSFNNEPDFSSTINISDDDLPF